MWTTQLSSLGESIVGVKATFILYDMSVPFKMILVLAIDFKHIQIVTGKTQNTVLTLNKTLEICQN